MNLVVFSGPPSSGKTSVIVKTIENLKNRGIKAGVVKFDCLYTDDDLIYKKNNILVRKGLSEVVQWGISNNLDILSTESAGLCNRCSPYIKNIKAVCVIDNLSGINTPKKIGPMLKSADYVVITKGDIVSQAEREVFSSRVASVNPSAIVMNINGLTGQGTYELSTLLYDENNSINTVNGMELKFAMPTALCSYCLGEKKIGAKYQMGNIKKMKLEDKNA